MTKYIMTAILFLGCGPKFGELNYKCEMQHTTMWFEFEPDCDIALANIRIAQALLEERGLMTIQENQWFTRDVPIYVYDMSVLWRNGDGTYTVGQWDGSAVHMTSDGYSLLHEWLHVMNSKQLQLGTAWHENWDKNGYDEADAEYYKRAFDLKYYSKEQKKLRSKTNSP